MSLISIDWKRYHIQKNKLDFKYVYQKNKKLSAARNTGVRNSTGKYI